MWKRLHPFGTRVPVAIAAALVLLTLGTCSYSGYASGGDDAGGGDAPDGAGGAAAVPVAGDAATSATSELEESIVGAVDRVLDSVVSIEVEVPVQSAVVQLHQGWPFSDPFGDGDPFDMFRPFLDPRQRSQGDEREDPPERLQRAGGSGVIHASDGTIVTNAHVVEDARTIRVTLHDGRTYEAEVVGLDPESDLAVIKIDETGLPAVRYADAGSVKPGQFAIAIGMPYGLDYSVTVGHISALGRAGLNPSPSSPLLGKDRSSFLRIQNFIQTDTVINPGNSGGPLVNLRGEVVGINSIVHGGIGGGFGFAIPADIVDQVASQLIDRGEVSRAWIGMAMTDLTYEKARAFGVDRNGGALVEEVYPDSPAEKARIRRGDVVLEVDGQRVDSASDVVYQVASHMAGEVVELTLQRDGKRKTVRVTAGDRSEGLSSAGVETGRPEDDEASPGDYGMVLEELDARLNERLNRPARAGGVLVRSVVPAGPAARAGIAAGDVIIDVDGREVDTPRDVTRALERATREYVPLTVERDGRQRFVALEREP